jgi:hypothetical protein
MNLKKNKVLEGLSPKSFIEKKIEEIVQKSSEKEKHKHGKSKIFSDVLDRYLNQVCGDRDNRDDLDRMPNKTTKKEISDPFFVPIDNRKSRLVVPSIRLFESQVNPQEYIMKTERKNEKSDSLKNKPSSSKKIYSLYNEPIENSQKKLLDQKSKEILNDVTIKILEENEATNKYNNKLDYKKIPQSSLEKKRPQSTSINERSSKFINEGPESEKQNLPSTMMKIRSPTPISTKDNQ